jgi:hypothetical protein
VSVTGQPWIFGRSKACSLALYQLEAATFRHQCHLSALTLAAILATVFGAVMGAGGQPETIPATSPGIGGFAFSNSSGSKLILLGSAFRSSSGQPDESGFTDMQMAAESVQTAFCRDGHRTPVRFERRQRDDGKAQGRQTRFAFDHLDGLIFQVLPPGLGDQATTCLVTTDTYAKALEPVAYRPAKGRYSEDVPECAPTLAGTIANRRSRPVRKCWTLTAGPEPGGPRVLAVEFARQGNDALASIVVSDGSRLIFADQRGSHASYGDSSVWRVDDPGTIVPSWFDVLLLARRGREIVLAFSWGAPEGAMVRLVESEGDKFRVVLGESWYQAPM